MVYMDAILYPSLYHLISFTIHLLGGANVIMNLYLFNSQKDIHVSRKYMVIKTKCEYFSYEYQIRANANLLVAVCKGLN